MLKTLDTVVAFAVIMTVLSLLITLVVQMVSATLSLRGKNLANALALTFQTIDPSIGKYAHSLAAQILRDPIFEQVMLVGEGRPYPVLLAVSKETDEAKLLERANAQLKRFPGWVRVRRVIRLSEPWSVDNGLLTPTLKLKRPLLTQKLAREIDAAYAE